MLECAWDAMYDAIPRLEAEESLQLFAVAWAATPASDRAGLVQRQRQLESWTDTIERIAHAVRPAALKVRLSQLDAMLRHAFKGHVTGPDGVDSHASE